VILFRLNRLSQRSYTIFFVPIYFIFRNYVFEDLDIHLVSWFKHVISFGIIVGWFPHYDTMLSTKLYKFRTNKNWTIIFYKLIRNTKYSKNIILHFSRPQHPPILWNSQWKRECLDVLFCILDLSDLWHPNPIMKMVLLLIWVLKELLLSPSFHRIFDMRDIF